jgi:Tol biopolymer transport system component/C-terminal processing protease CtpA/Prc
MNFPAFLNGLTAFFAAGLIATGAVPMRLISAPGLSPDGKTLVFEWCGDLWTAAASGGEAIRVADHPARDGYPQFTPDGKRIVFSSERTGSLQLFSIPTTGGEPTRHTDHTEGNELECLSPDGGSAIVRGTRERCGFRETRLMEISLAGDRRELRLFDAQAHSAAWSPDGARILFCRGGEQLYRKGFQGSRASQIWEYDLAGKTFESRIAETTEARSPVWNRAGKSFHYISARNGTANVWRHAAGKSTQVTRFEGDGVISLAQSADGSVMVLRRGFDVYQLIAGGTPQRIDLWTREKLPDISRHQSTLGGTSDVDFTRDLDGVVFAAAGDLWHQNQRLLETPQDESDVHFSPDHAWLYFLRDDGVTADYFRARFKDGTLGDEQPVTQGPRSKSRFTQSADGSKIAWAEATGDVFTADADGRNPRRIFACWDMPTFDLSPDGRWLAIAAKDANSNRDLWLAAADANSEPVNLTRIPGFEGSPRWSPDGKWLAHTARKDATAELVLRLIPVVKNGPMVDKAVTVSTKGIEPTRLIWAADSKAILFQSSNSKNPNLYSVEPTGKNMETVIAQRGIPIRMTPDGTLLWRVDRNPAVLKKGELTRFPVSLTASQSREAVNTLGFRRIWRTLGERFYDPAMNGTDWNALLESHQPLAAGARDSRQFDRVVSQLFGELNASHLSFLRTPWPGEAAQAPREEKTAHPGMEFTDEPVDGPLVIARVIAGSPVAKWVEPGETVLRIGGREVTNFTPLHRLFKGAADRPLPVVIRDKSGRERVIELRCISYARARSLDAEQQHAIANKSMPGGISYLPVPNMNRETFDRIESAVYQAALKSAGMILDLRDNGGGREADRLLSLFCQPAHSLTLPRGGPAGYPYDRLAHAAWHKPLVVLCNEGTFSNSEIFCHAILLTKRAPVVGVATAGGVISAVKAKIPGVGELQVPFRGWFHAKTGVNLDLNGAQPDFPVNLTPADQDGGRDPQLEKALELVRGQVREAAAPVRPVFRQ